MSNHNTPISLKEYLDRIELNLYLDIETCDTAPTAAVWQIGIVGIIIDHNTHQSIPIDLESGVQVTFSSMGENEYGGATSGTMSDGTLNWLRDKQLSPNSRDSLGTYSFDNPSIGLVSLKAQILNCLESEIVYQLIEYNKDVIQDDYPLEGDVLLKALVSDRKRTTIYTWGNFDQPILENAFITHEVETPFHYGSFCSLRDVHKFLRLPSSFRPDTSSHEAIRDAMALMQFHEKLNACVNIGITYAG